MKKDLLKDLIAERAFKYSEFPAFKLANGGWSRHYFNCKRVTLDPKGQSLVGRLVYDAIRGLHIDGVGGPAVGAIPIAAATIYTAWCTMDYIQAFFVRSEQKDHGIAARVEGNLEKGNRVVVVDDVITTGGSTLKAIEACRDAGLEVVKVVALIDRQEMNGRENILREVGDVEALVTRDEIVALCKAKEEAPRKL